MNFMNLSLYFNFRNHILNFLIDYLNCLPNMQLFEVNAQKIVILRMCCVSPIFNS